MQAPSSSVSAAIQAGNYPQSDAVANEMLRLMNQERAKSGAQPLQQVSALDTIAATWSDRMAGEGRLYHNPQFGQLTFATGANRAAENVAYGSRTPGSPEQLAQTLFNQWMNSPGHRANILNANYNAIGFGVSIDSRGGYYATHNFGGYRTVPTS